MSFFYFTGQKIDLLRGETSSYRWYGFIGSKSTTSLYRERRSAGGEFCRFVAGMGRRDESLENDRHIFLEVSSIFRPFASVYRAVPHHRCCVARRHGCHGDATPGLADFYMYEDVQADVLLQPDEANRL